MTRPPHNDADRPVYVSPLDPNVPFRIVRVENQGPGLAQARPCASTNEFIDFVREVRPDLDLSTVAIFWDGDHAWQWSGA